jgi:uncharacterized membrane protein (UPF0127 family)
MLKIEIADNPEKWQTGLMYRKSLDVNSGMLFRFDRPFELSFWGKNTYIPLDIAFVSPESKIVKISRITPLSTHSVNSDLPCLYAIETNLGFFEKNGIKTGDLVKIQKNDDYEDVIVFGKNEGN